MIFLNSTHNISLWSCQWLCWLVSISPVSSITASACSALCCMAIRASWRPCRARSCSCCSSIFFSSSCCLRRFSNSSFWSARITSDLPPYENVHPHTVKNTESTKTDKSNTAEMVEENRQVLTSEKGKAGTWCFGSTSSCQHLKTTWNYHCNYTGNRALPSVHNKYTHHSIWGIGRADLNVKRSALHQGTWAHGRIQGPYIVLFILPCLKTKNSLTQTKLHRHVYN